MRSLQIGQELAELWAKTWFCTYVFSQIWLKFTAYRLVPQTPCEPLTGSETPSLPIVCTETEGKRRAKLNTLHADDSLGVIIRQRGHRDQMPYIPTATSSQFRWQGGRVPITSIPLSNCQSIGLTLFAFLWPDSFPTQTVTHLDCNSKVSYCPKIGVEFLFFDDFLGPLYYRLFAWTKRNININQPKYINSAEISSSHERSVIVRPESNSPKIVLNSGADRKSPDPDYNSPKFDIFKSDPVPHTLIGNEITPPRERPCGREHVGVIISLVQREKIPVLEVVSFITKL
eukprot:sb/3467716/